MLLDDDDPTLPKTLTVTALPGLYRIEEKQVPGWVLKSIVCNNPRANVTIQFKKGRVEVDIKAGENIACFFNNELSGLDYYLGYNIKDVEPDF